MTETTIDDLVIEQKRARNHSIIWGVGSLAWFGNAAYQAFSEEGNGNAAIAYVVCGTLYAVNTVLNYRRYRTSREQQP